MSTLALQRVHTHIAKSAREYSSKSDVCVDLCWTVTQTLTALHYISLRHVHFAAGRVSSVGKNKKELFLRDHHKGPHRPRIRCTLGQPTVPELAVGVTCGSVSDILVTFSPCGKASSDWPRLEFKHVWGHSKLATSSSWVLHTAHCNLGSN